jgi:fused signal recognition particle receptor
LVFLHFSLSNQQFLNKAQRQTFLILMNQKRRLVLDANTGQNALAQVNAFDEALQLTGLVVTKLDGTARGGVLAAIAGERPVPVYFVGVGEALADLHPFNAQDFVDALIE